MSMSVAEIAAQGLTVVPDDPDRLRPVELRAERAAAQVGTDIAEVERLPFDLSVIESDGIFVNVDARNFGLLDRRLDWRALGFSLPRTGEVAFRPPRCGLVPDRYRLPLLRPANRAHAAPHKFSYHFRIIETVFETSEYRWVPWRGWPEFEREFNAAKAGLQAALETYETDLEAIREMVLETFRQLAADSARRLQATGQPVPDDFEDAVVQEVLSALASPDLLGRRLSLRYRVGVMQLGSEMLAEQRSAAEERRRLEQVDAERRLEHHRLDAEQRVVQEALWAEQAHLRRQLRAEEEERRREALVKERLRQLKLEAARERLQEALSPLEEGARQLHAAVFEAATAIRASLQQHRSLHGWSARKARDLSAWFKRMAWQGDQQLEALVRELEQLASAPTSKKRKRDPGPIDEVLGDIIALTYSATARIHQFANFVLVDVGDGSAFRRALLPHGIVVRDCTSFGLPSGVRIACRLPEQCTRLLEVVESLKLQ